MQPGLYDINDNLIKTWSELESAGVNIKLDHSNPTNKCDTIGTSQIFEKIWDKNPNDYKLIVPDGIARIGNYALCNCKHLVEIVLPNTIEIICYAAFENCQNLEKINIPENTKIIDSDAFNNCHSLLEVNLPEGLTKIDTNAFADCWMLKHITIPSSIKRIEASTFCNCRQLEEINFHDDIYVIEGYAFADCKKLTKVTLPRKLTYLSDSAFKYCNNLECVKIPGYVYMGENLFLGSNIKELWVHQFTVNLNPDLEKLYGDKLIIVDKPIEDLVNEGASFKDINKIKLEVQGDLSYI